MNPSKKQAVTALAVVAVMVVGVIMLAELRSTRRNKELAAAAGKAEQAKIAATMVGVKEANAGMPDPMVQAKILIMTAMIQKRIPAAAGWCDTLNAGNKVWPSTPTNTAFALNSQVANRPYSRSTPLPGDVVVFYETANPGWNLAGGAELLANKPEGMAVAFGDGRAIIVAPDQIPNLRWSP